MNQKSQLIRFSKLCCSSGFIGATDGNLSIRAKKNIILVTSSGTNRGKLTSSDIVETTLRGKKIKGRGKISSEFKLHAFIYSKRKDINAVIHTHPRFACVFAACGIALDKVVFPEVFLKLGRIPLAQYATPSTDEVPRSIARLVKGHNAILLANHGLVTFAEDIEEAYYITEKAERFAEISFYARLLGGERELSDVQKKKLLNIRYQTSKIQTKNQ